jgi:dimethylamine monooxygenase subunit A
MTLTNISELLAEEDFSFKMRFQRGRFAEFFGRTGQREQLLSQRKQQLESEPRTYAALLAGGEPLLSETVRMAAETSSICAEDAARLNSASSPWEQCLVLGQVWEPDYLLLKISDAGPFQLLGGVVCFPSSWRISEKIGQSMEFIHGVVPGLNAALGGSIHLFMERIKPGAAWLRSNWGLSASPELNHHPDRSLPRLTQNVSLDQVWLRVEEQALVRLPETGGVLFGIRLHIFPLPEVKQNSEASRGLARALRTMPDSIAEYKSLAQARQRLIELIEH